MGILEVRYRTMPASKRSFQDRRRVTNADYYQRKKAQQQTDQARQETNFYDKQELY